MIVRTGICYVFREGGRTGSKKAGCRTGVRYKRERKTQDNHQILGLENQGDSSGMHGGQEHEGGAA